MGQNVSNLMTTDRINLTFQQKSTVVSLIITLFATVYYFTNAWQLQPIAEASGTIPDGFGSLILNTVLVITISQIVLQIVLAFGSGSAPTKTAHEVQASLKAQRNAYFVLIFTIFVSIASFWGDIILFYSVDLLIIGFVLSEVVKHASQLFYARK